MDVNEQNLVHVILDVLLKSKSLTINMLQAHLTSRIPSTIRNVVLERMCSEELIEIVPETYLSISGKPSVLMTVKLKNFRRQD